MSSRPECIFEIHKLWQSGFSRVYFNSYCSCSFEPKIIKIGLSSHKMYSNNILNFQESTTILNACIKQPRILLKALWILFPNLCLVLWFLTITMSRYSHFDFNTSRYHSNYIITEIGQNTEKSPGYFRRLAVAQTSLNDWVGRWSIGNCVRSLNLTLRTNTLCPTQNSS